jgi:hypothetical protein
VTAVEAADALEFPALFVAITENVYAVPFVNPVMVQAVRLVVQEPPGTPVAVNPVIADPPFELGADHVSAT